MFIGKLTPLNCFASINFMLFNGAKICYYIIMKFSLSNIIFGILLVVLLGIFIAGFLILNRSASPMTEKEKVQALDNILGRPVVLQEKKVPAGDITYQGKYVSFLYPAAAEKFVPSLNGTPIPSKDLEDFYFSLGDDPRIDVTTTVTKVSSVETSIADEPSVRLRQSQKDIYQQTEITADKQNGLAFTKVSGGIEETAFFFVNNKIYTFAVSGSDQQNVTALYNKIILSIKFL